MSLGSDGLGGAAASFRLRRRAASAVCPFYMGRQHEVNASMRRILVDWLVELYDELELPPEALLQAIYQSDRFLTSHPVPKEVLQLVGAVALMLACNHLCKLPHQDGEEPAVEHRLNHAEDIVYWTDGTYTIDEVHAIEAQLLHGHEGLGHTSPLEHLALACFGSGLTDECVSLAAELIVVSSQDYRTLQLDPRLLAACALFLAVHSLAVHSVGAPSGTAEAEAAAPVWTPALAARVGYPTAALVEHVRTYFRSLDGEEVAYRPKLAADGRQRTLRATIVTRLDDDAPQGAGGENWARLIAHLV